ncbi:hypothetical protein [Acholeplasma hippikon]|nr:hypothetical protein [Acholeplasma hippikon]
MIPTKVERNYKIGLEAIRDNLKYNGEIIEAAYYDEEKIYYLVYARNGFGSLGKVFAYYDYLDYFFHMIEVDSFASSKVTLYTYGSKKVPNYVVKGKIDPIIYPALIFMLTGGVLIYISYRRKNKPMISMKENQKVSQEDNAIDGYKIALAAYFSNDYQKAYAYFAKDITYKDTPVYLLKLKEHLDISLEEAMYQEVLKAIEDNDKRLAIYFLSSLENYKDGKALLEEIKTQNIIAEKERIYQKAVELSKSEFKADKVKSIKLFKIIFEYKDSQKYIEQYELIKKKKFNKYKKIVVTVSTLVIVLFISVPIIFNEFYVKKEIKYSEGLSYIYDKNYDEARKIFNELNNYKDAKKISTLIFGLELLDLNHYEEAINQFKDAGYEIIFIYDIGYETPITTSPNTIIDGTRVTTDIEPSEFKITSNIYQFKEWEYKSYNFNIYIDQPIKLYFEAIWIRK